MMKNKRIQESNFCVKCLKEKDKYFVKNFKEEDFINGVFVKYHWRRAYCPDCGSEIYAPKIEEKNIKNFRRTFNWFNFLKKTKERFKKCNNFFNKIGKND